MLLLALLFSNAWAAPAVGDSEAVALAGAGPGAAASETLVAFASELSAAGLPLAGAPYAAAVVARGPADPQYEVALKLLVAGSLATGDWTEIDALSGGLPATSACCADALHYRRGLQAIAAGDTGAGTAELRQVGATSDLYLPAQVAAATTYAGMGKLKSSVRAYTAAAKVSGTLPTPAAVAEADRLVVRSVLGISRIYVGLGQLEQATLYLGTIEPSSVYGAEAAVETAWVRLAMGDPTAATAAIAGVPRAGAWIPERALVQLAIAVATGGDPGSAPAQLHAAVDPVRAALEAGMGTTDAAARKVYSTLPPGLADRLRRDRELQETLAALEQVAQEQTTLRAPKWKSLRAGLVHALEARRLALEAREGARLRVLFQTQVGVLDQLVAAVETLSTPAAAGEDAAARLARVNTILVELPVDPEGGPPLRRGRPILEVEPTTP